MSEWFEAEAHADRALEMYERGRWAEAESELRKALSLNPDQAEWHYNLGLTLEAAGRDLEALTSYQRVIDLLPDQAEPLVAAGVVCNRLRRYGQAVGWLDQALVLAPTSETAYAHKIDALARLGDHDEAEATYYMAQQAIEEPSPHCLAAIAESLIDRSDFGRAGWCIREALRLEPQMPRLRARLAAVLAATGRPQRALQMYLRDLRDDPGNIDTLLDYGELLIDVGRLAEAAEKFRRVLELEPANVDAHFRLGQVAMTSSRFEQAHLEFELVLKLDPQFPGIRLALGEALLRRGKLAAAQGHLRDELDAETDAGDAPDDDPTPRGPESGRRGPGADGPVGGVAADDRGELRAMDRLSDRDGRIERSGPPRSPRELVRFADLLMAARLPVEAAGVYEAALEAGGQQSAELLRKLALARFESGDRDGGVAASRRVLRFDPASVPAIHNLALAALQAGQLQVAAGWIARGLRVDRHDDGLRRLRMKHWFAWLGARIGALASVGRGRGGGVHRPAGDR